MDEQQTQADLAYVNSLLDRLLERYLAREPVPGGDHKPVDVALLHRLAFAVVAEGYGR